MDLERSVEQREMPKIALSAARLVQQEYERQMNNLAAETLECMGLIVGTGWMVDFKSGVATRVKTEE